MEPTRLTVLAIDDNRDNLVTLAAVLHDALPGCTVMTALDGERGIALARSADPDVILLDIVMPGMDGFEVCRRLKGDDALRTIPVVFLTALHTGRDNRLKALEVGAEGFLSKPPAEEELVAQVRAMAKIRAANRRAQLDREQLAELVAERTRVLVRELAERARAEAALRVSEARNRAITQSAHDAIVTTDVNGGVVSWNNGAQIIFGYTAQEMLGRPVSQLIPGRFQDAHRAGMHRMRAGTESKVIGKTVELGGVRKDGTEFPLELSLARWETGDGWFFTGIMRDVSERVRDAAVLRLEGAALEAAANAIVITDHTGVITWSNAAFTNCTGYRRDEAVGRRPGELLNSGTHDATYYAAIWQTILAGDVWHGELVNRRKDGSLYTEDMTITPLKDEAGVITHFIGVQQDITQRKALEEQFRQSQKMESVGRLAGGVAHDFNNMLGVILGHVELALAEVPPGAPIRTDLEEIHEAAQRSADLTRQLLAFARKQNVIPRVIDVNATVAGSLRMMQRLIGENVALVWRPGEALWPITMDASQMDQILANLCVNARDAITGVGEITIATSNCEADGALAATSPDAVPGDYVRITVSDTGSGMSSDVAAQIFEPFFTTKAFGEGTGLGLSTVYGAVRQNRGFITVASAPGEGTSFDLYLPRYTGAVEPALRQGAPTLVARGTETILVVEDEPPVLRMTRRALETHGYTVLCASSPADAIRIVETHRGEIHLVLTDVIMPELNGWDLAKSLCARRPDLKHLLMSGYTANVLDASSLPDRDQHFIAKPFTVGDLAMKVRGVLDQQTALA